MVDPKEKEKGVAAGTSERTPKAGRSRSRKKDKGVAEPSTVVAEEVNPQNTTPIGPEIAGGMLMVQTNLGDIWTREGDDPLNRENEEHDEEAVESSNAVRQGDVGLGNRPCVKC